MSIPAATVPTLPLKRSMDTLNMVPPLNPTDWASRLVRPEYNSTISAGLWIPSFLNVYSNSHFVMKLMTPQVKSFGARL